MSLYVAIFSDSAQVVTYSARGVTFSTNEHGYSSLSCFVRADIPEAFYIYDRVGTLRVQVKDSDYPVWDGRLEDVAIVDGGVRLGAFGYQRALSDTLYTGSFSATDSATIAAALLASVRSVNSTQLDATTRYIATNSVTFTDSYEDARPSDILNRLAAAGDASGNPWEWGVYNDKVLYFRQRGSGGKAWYVDAASLELERSLDKLYNSVYGIYTGQTNTKARTATSTDTASVIRYGITRQAAVGQNLDDTTLAEYARNSFLSQYSVATPRARVKFSRVFDSSGGTWPIYYVRSGDTITIRNLPANSSAGVDVIRTFYVVSTTYSADDDTLDVELSSNTPTIDRQISQSGGNVSGTVSAGADSGILTVKPQYIFGTWTPAFAGTGTAGTFTYVNQQGTYTRIGNRVLLTGRLTISAITVAPTGTMRITGLPRTVATAYAPFAFGGIDNLVYPAGALQILAIAVIGQTYANIQYSVTNAAGVAYPAASFTNAATDLVFSCQYQM